ncbi:zinc finger protein 865 isoform X1 [Schistocerca gregaria]|uniref:zinc finger protein 865 isoform X1 n=1 Tax=Schistocerca gregaria TaxID=7010 RepID=UPI00211EE9CE|nr:zinc finger protein 865 isoform X1 [Schistocerca gregaria]
MMDVAFAATTMDTYEDMFKEITRKLYGEEADVETGGNGNGSGGGGGGGGVGAGGGESVGVGAVLRSIVADYEEQEAHHGHGHGSALAAFGLAALMHQQQQQHHSHHHHQQHQALQGPADRWLPSDEPPPAWAGGSRVATYNPAQKLFRCADCGCVGFLARVAEHWLGSHANLRVFHCPQCPYSSAWARCVRTHLTRQHAVAPADADAALFANNPVLEEVSKFLHRLKARAEAAAAAAVAGLVRPPPPPPLLVPQACPPPPPSGHPPPPPPPSHHPPAPSLPPPPPPPPAPSASQQQQQQDSGGVKRYCCGYCPYSTDRRDLFTRHENIHREEKPFQCYVCQKQFNRADHVKKHFLRMHRDYPYDLNRVRRQPDKSPPAPSPGPAAPAVPTPGATPGLPHHYFAADRPGARPLSVPPPTAAHPPLHALDVPAGFPPPVLRPPTYPPPPPDCGGKRAGCTAKSHASKNKKKADKRYSCCYCSWSGVDNWCLKRHLNTHLKPFVCALCDYKAARAERLATHVLKVHNKRACGKCSFLADDQAQLAIHRQEHHHPWEHGNGFTSDTLSPSHPHSIASASGHQGAAPSNHFGLLKREQQYELGLPLHAFGAPRAAPKQQHFGAARLFHYMEASDTSDQDDEQEPVSCSAQRPPPPVGCRQCGCEFADVNSLQTHQLVHHTAKSGAPEAATDTATAKKPCTKPLPYRCSVCECSLASQALMLEHMRIHNGRLLACKERGCAFVTPLGESALRDHSKMHSPSVGNTPLCCPHCQHPLDSVESLQRHRPLHHLPETPCDLCDSVSQKFRHCPPLSATACCGSGCVDMKTGTSLECSFPKTDQATAGTKRSRKQRQPRRVVARGEDASEIRVLKHSASPKPRSAKWRTLGASRTLCQLREKYMSGLLSRKRIRCSWCPQQAPLFPYHTPATLALHNSWRHSIRKFECEHCSETFRHRYQVIIHSSREHAAVSSTSRGNGPEGKPVDDVSQQSGPESGCQGGKERMTVNTPACPLAEPTFPSMNVPDSLSENVPMTTKELCNGDNLRSVQSYTKNSILNIPLPPPIMATSSSVL